MINEARKIIEDIASGKIKDERLALFADQLKISDRKLSEAAAQLAILKSENTSLKEQIQQLESALNSFRLKLETEISGRKQISDEAQAMLETLFDADSDLTIDRIASPNNLSGNTAKFHFDFLIRERLVNSYGSEPQPYYVGERQTFKPTYQITPSGREQVMLTRQNQLG